MGLHKGTEFIIDIWLRHRNVVYVHKRVKSKTLRANIIKDMSYDKYKLAFIIKPKQK